MSSATNFPGDDVPEVQKTWNVNSKETDLLLRLALEEFCDLQTPMNAVLSLQVLYNIHKRIQDEPEMDKYYRVYIRGEIFERYVWLLAGSQKCLHAAGWVKCGNYMILSKSYPIKQSVNVISELLKKKKKAQVLHSGSVLNHGQHKRPDISLRRVRSNVGDSTINEDEILESYTNIEAPVQDSDSAIGSAFEDEEETADYKPRKHRLRRVESKEHIVGNEEYIVVDFIGNLEVSSRRSSKIDAPTLTDALAATSPISNTSAFEEIYTENNTDVTSQENEEKDHSDETSESVQEKPRKIFSVGYGLKKATSQKEEEEEVSKNSPSSDTDSIHSTTSTQSAPVVKRMDSSNDASATRGRRPVKDTTNLERTSSQKSISSDSGRPGSLVMQHKRMFDQQISAGLKQKYGSTQSLDSRRRTSNLDLSNFEKPKTGHSSSLNERRNYSRKDVDMTGIVAASRGMFEQGNNKSSVPPTATETDAAETYKPLPDSESSTTNPYLSNYLAKDNSSKKKKFPFKKRKVEKINDQDSNKYKAEKKNNVELLSAKPIEKYEERAIDVPADVFNDEVEEVTEKKKKGLFSRIRKHRKSSSDSEHENKHSLERKKKQSSDQEIIHEQNAQDSQEDTEAVNEEHGSELQIDLQDNSSYSSEAASVLENIMERRSSVASNDSKKKKKKKFLKKLSRGSLGTKSSENSIPVVGDESEAPVDFKESVVSDKTAFKEPEVNDKLDFKETEVNDTPAFKEQDVSDTLEREVDTKIEVGTGGIDKSPISVDGEEIIQEVIRTDRLISDWSFEIEDELDDMKGEEHHDLKEETIPEESSMVEDVDVKIDETPESPNIQVNQSESKDDEPAVTLSKSDSSPSVEVTEPPTQSSVENGDVALDVLSQEDDSGVCLDSAQHSTQPVNSAQHSTQPAEVTNNAQQIVPATQVMEEEDDLADLLTTEAIKMRSASLSQRTVSEADSISYDEQHEIESINSSVSTMDDDKKKKKGRFKFLKKGGKKQKNKKDVPTLNVSLPDDLDEHSSQSSPIKKSSFKRPKSLENLVDLLPRKGKKGSRPNSMTEEDVNLATTPGLDENDHEKHGKTKKKLSFFKKKNKGDPPSPVKSPSKSPINHHDNVQENFSFQNPEEDSKQTFVSSDEFRIPESNTNVADVRQAVNKVGDEPNPQNGKTTHHKEFIKNQEILEVKTSESMEI